MQGIEFEDEKDLGLISVINTQTPEEEETSFAIDLLEKAGIVEESTAKLILLVITLVFFALTIYLYAGLSSPSDPQKRTAGEITAQLKVIREMQNVK